MKKKLIGLSTLLLVLLLGLSSNCYASGYTLTRSDTDKIASKYNYSDAKKTGFWNAINDAQSNYDTIVVNCYNANYGTWKVTAFNASQVTAITNIENINYMSTTCSGTSSQYGNDGNSYYKIDRVNQEWVFGSGSQKRSAYMFISNNFYTYENAPWENIQVIGPFELPLTFIPKVTDTYADVWTYEDVPFYNASGEDLYLGQLLVPITYQGYKDSLYFYWQYGNWQFKELTDYASYLVYVGSENGSSLYDVYLLRDYINENMLYDITFTDVTTEPLYTLASCIFYIKNNNTIITNGALNPHSTFSGDYKDEYDDNLQNLQDIENIKTGTEPILDFLSNTDISSGDEPTFSDLPSIDIDDDSEEFFTWLLSSFLSVLNNNSNTNLTIPLFNNNYTIPSNFFVLNIEPLRTFINLGWWFICGVPFLKFIRSSIEKLKGGNIPLADEKSDLLGHII